MPPFQNRNTPDSNIPRILKTSISWIRRVRLVLAVRFCMRTDGDVPQARSCPVRTTVNSMDATCNTAQSEFFLGEGVLRKYFEKHILLLARICPCAD